jgi:DNA invertase Pin-like site-specific DNA recombinase
MKYCYIRVSRDSQEYTRQIQIFKDRGYLDGTNCTYVEEKFTGTKINRPEFSRLLDDMKEGDTLIVESLSRLSRGGVIKTLDLITELVQVRKINVIIFKEGFELRAGEQPNSTTSLLLGIFSVLGQFERDLISERTKEGLKAVKNSGVKLGRKFDERSNKENFIKVLEYMIQNNCGMMYACKMFDMPLVSFERKIQECYVKYNTKDYEIILDKLRGDKWELYY